MTKSISDIRARVPYGWEHREPLLELDFPIAEFQRRIHEVQRALAHRGLDVLTVYGRGGEESNVRYLSGFGCWWGESIVMVPRDGDPVLMTNAIFHGEPMHSNLQTTWIKDVRPLLSGHYSTTAPKSLIQLARGVLEEGKFLTGRIAFVDLDQAPIHVERELKTAWTQVELCNGLPILQALRRIKSHAEIEVLRRLGRITSAGMDAGMAAVKVGAPESEVAAAVHGGCIAAGAERMHYGCLASAGPRSHMKNVFPRPEKKIGQDELVVIDIGCKFAGYQSDMSRNIIAGTPTPQLRRMLEACLEAEEVGIEHTKPGVEAISVVEAMKNVVARHGFAPWDWTTGHGFGMDIAEDPFFYPTSSEPLEPGMCFYIEPMIIPTEVGTVCIEDMVVVTENGCEELTHSKKRVWQ